MQSVRTESVNLSPPSDNHPGACSSLARISSRNLTELLRSYRLDQRPVEVAFRKMVGPLPINDLTHSLYPYPARLLRQIPRFFLHCDQLVDANCVVLDPFCGSGTVLVEAQSAGLRSLGIDCNPFAQLLSRVKTTRLPRRTVIAAATSILRRGKLLRTADIPDVVNVDLWYTSPIKQALGRLRRAILEASQPKSILRLMLVCFAAVVNRCSLRDPRIPVPVRHRDWARIGPSQNTSMVWDTFALVVRRAADLTDSLPASGPIALVSGTDACTVATTCRKLSQRIARPSLAITSPPYGTAQKYVRSTALALGWTGLATTTDLPQLARESIGHERVRSHELGNLEVAEPDVSKALQSIALRDPIRASLYARYFRKMDAALGETFRTLQPGGHLVLIAGSNTVAGEVVSTHGLLHRLALRHGFRTALTLRDRIRGRVLLTKRASGAIPLGAETIYLLSKRSA